MESRIFALLGMLFAVVLTVSAVPEARANNINIGTSECQDTTGQNNIGRDINGVYTIGGPISGFVTCSLPRSPLNAAATGGAFYVDGDNFNGAYVNCTIYSYNFDGTFLGAVSFVATEAHFDRYVGLPAPRSCRTTPTRICCAACRVMAIAFCEA